MGVATRRGSSEGVEGEEDLEEGGWVVVADEEKGRDEGMERRCGRRRRTSMVVVARMEAQRMMR